MLTNDHASLLPREPLVPDGNERSLVQRAVRMGEAAARLPAIATLDWCESAARVLGGLDTGATAGVLIAQVDSAGTVRSFEAAGVACGEPSPHDERVIRTLPELRWQLETLTSLGWRPEMQPESAGVCGGRLSQLHDAAWRDGPAAAAWKPLFPAELFVGVADMAGEVRSRRVVAYVALPSESTIPPGLTDVFLAVLRLIGEAASRAIGFHRPGRSIWISPKEQDVLDRLILGYSVREIAEELRRSPHTMHDHVKSLHRKLGATSRGDLIARALGHRSASPATTRATPLRPFEFTEPRPRPGIAKSLPYRPEP